MRRTSRKEEAENKNSNESEKSVRGLKQTNTWIREEEGTIAGKTGQSVDRIQNMRKQEQQKTGKGKGKYK